MTVGSGEADPTGLSALYEQCLGSAEPDRATGDDSEKSALAEALRVAREESSELGGHAPDANATALLQLLASMSQASSAVYIGSAPGVVALSLLTGMSSAAGGTKPGMVTAITSDPHHSEAGKKAVKAAGFPASSCRVIAARPLEVMGKLAAGSYGLVVAHDGEVEAKALATRGLELVGGGAVVVLDSISFFDDVDGLPESARITRLPLGDGMSILTA